MKITANAGALGKALSIVTRAAGKPTSSTLTHPVLSSVYMSAASTGMLSLAATDGEVSISLRSKASVEEPGAVALPARTLTEVVRSLSTEEEVTIASGSTDIATGSSDNASSSGDGGGATLTTSKSSYRLRAYRAADFPELPQPAGGSASFSVPADELTEAVEDVIGCAAKDPQRSVLGSLHITFQPSKATLAATDSYR